MEVFRTKVFKSTLGSWTYKFEIHYDSIMVHKISVRTGS